MYIEYWFRVWLPINNNYFKVFDLKLNYVKKLEVLLDLHLLGPE